MNKTGLVALIVLAIASLLMIFVIMPNLDTATAPQPAATAPAAPPAAPSAPATSAPATPAPAAPQASALPGASDQAATPPAAQGAEPAAPTADTAADAPPAGVAPDLGQAAAKGARPTADGLAAAAPEAMSDAPRFDVLRVEPDGSTVIAGRAAPRSKLEIVNGETVVGRAEAAPNGDFAAVFDTPLPPGDYQLTLRATAPDGKTRGSEEVATVSIPDKQGGDLLAMVSKPGEASRIITAPGLAGEAAAPKADGGTAAPLPPVSTDAATPGPATAMAPASPSATAADPAPAGPAQTSQAPAAPPAAAGAQISVTAVELEGDRIFVAGTARSGATVRIYVDDRFVGEAKADAGGRFIVEGQLAMSVGQHMIRADMLGPDGGKVQMRASVPFERPEGDQIAAVAPPVTGSAADFDGGAFDAARIEASKAFSLLKGLYANGATPSAEQVAAARSATEFALGSLSAIKVAPTVDAGLRGMVETTTKAARDALAILTPLPRDVAAVGAAIGRLESLLGPVLKPAMPAPAPMESGQPSSPAPTAQRAAPADASAAAPAAGQGAPADTSEPQTVQQAPLQQSRSSVIIRRGDTLWQISRRVYGAGVRYTTIYVANEDQIADPDRILPGQIFGVPEKALPDAESEEIHRRHMKQLR